MSQYQDQQIEQRSGAGDASGATAVKEAPQMSPPRVDELPPYRVLLHNDDINVRNDVAEAIVDLTPLDMQRAIEITVEAHTTGVALVLVTHLELAELYQDQLQSKRLTVTIEPAE